MEGYDPSSGQVYRETIIGAKRKKPTDWKERCRGAVLESVAPATGAASLYEIAMRNIVNNSNAIQPETLAGMPKLILERIWRNIRRHGRESLLVFLAFANNACGDKTFLHNVDVVSAGQPLFDKFATLTNVDCLWMTDLKITDILLSAGNLRQLSSVSNLRNLQIRYPFEGNENAAFDNSLLSNLASQASERGALQKLEMIFLENVPGITSKAFESLSKFIALDTFCVCQTGIKGPKRKLAGKYGWKRHSDNSPFSSFMKERRLKAAYRSEPAGFSYVANDYIERRRSRTLLEPYDVPVIRALFGGPPASRRNVMHNVDFDDVFCFERDSKVLPHQSTTEIASQEYHSGTKKRKLKHGKAVDLDTMLDDFVRT